MTTRITSANIATGAVTSDRIAANALTLDKIAVGTFGPRITSIVLPGSAVAVLPNGSENFTINGSNFQVGVQVYIGTTPAAAVTYISSTQLVVTVPVMSPGTYPLYVTNTDGGTAIRLLAITVSTAPVWATGSVLPAQTQFVSLQLSAGSDSTVIYSLAGGSSLPPGLSLSTAGLLSGTITVVTVLTTYNFTVIATDAESQTNSRAFSVSVTTADANFLSVPLLLQTGASLSRSTVVADSSPSNFVVTRAGTPSTGLNSPYQTDGFWSTYFPGSTTTYLTVPASNVINFGTGSFTVELWFYINPGATSNASWQRSNLLSVQESQYSSGFAIELNGTTIGGTGIRFNIAGATGVQSTAAVSQGVWHHVAVSRSGSTAYLFLDGVLLGTGTNSGNVGNVPLTIGAYKTIDPQYDDYFAGYISNLRILKGVMLYTATFIPPAGPLFAFSTSVSLLTCQSNRFIDNSGNNVAITVTGSPQIPPVYPTTFIASPIALGAALFNGTSDYLTVGSNSALAFGTNNFTIECWVWFNTTSGTQEIYSSQPTGSYAVAPDVYISSGKFYVQVSSSNPINGTGPTTVVTNRWYHVALVRNSGTTTLYVNGAVEASFSDSNTYVIGANRPVIGVYGSNTGVYYLNGYLSNLRVVNGTAVYTGAFTPPSNFVTQTSGTYPNTTNVNTSITAANTALLLNFTDSNYTSITNAVQNNTFIDEGYYSFPITRNGTATQGTFTPFWPNGQWSNYFNGSTDYLTAPSNAAFAMGTGDFTIECWVNTPVVNANNDVLIELRSTGATSTGFVFNMNPTGVGYQLNFYTDGGFNLGSTVLNYNAWNHVAVTRSGTTVRLFSNGVVSATFTKANNFSDTPVPRIGSSPLYSPSSVNGYISNFRVVKGTAVYTTAFTPPTTPLTAITNTVLLTCQSNRFRDSSANNFAITATGTPQVQAFQPFSPAAAYTAALYGGSGYFNGTTDYLNSTTAATAFQFGSSPFTIESWIYQISRPARQYICGGVFSGAGFQVVIEPSGLIFTGVTGVGDLPAATIAVPLNAWTHFAVVRTSISTNGAAYYINGVPAGTFTISSNISGTASSINVGTSGNGSSIGFNGYISNFRTVKETAVYTGAFTPHTLAPLTTAGSTSAACYSNTTNVNTTFTVVNTSLLLNFTNAAIYDAAAQNDIVTIGNAQASSIITAKWGTTSMRFDGSGSFLTMLANSGASTTITSGDFTIEFWLNPSTVAPATQAIVGTRYNDSANNINWGVYLAYNQLGFFSYSSAQTLIGSITHQTTLSINTWYYCALVRSGSTFTLYVNGVAGTSTLTSSATMGQFYPTLFVGRFGSVTAMGILTGYIQDLRITRGVARTVTSVPTAAFLTR
jgi:hypothetical protein